MAFRLPAFRSVQGYRPKPDVLVHRPAGTQKAPACRQRYDRNKADVKTRPQLHFPSSSHRSGVVVPYDEVHRPADGNEAEERGDEDHHA